MDMKIHLFAFISIIHLSLSQNDCLPAQCGPFGPAIRFPFRLKNLQPEHCGYPGFELSCTEDGRTLLDLQFPITASPNDVLLPFRTTVSVGTIDYRSQKILASNSRAILCPPEKVTSLNSSSASPTPIFEVEVELEPIVIDHTGYTLFNCSGSRDSYNRISCLSGANYEVVAFFSSNGITNLPPRSSCFKMYNISYVPDNVVTGRDDEYGTRFFLRWSNPSCGNCEADGKYCRLKNGTQETECFAPEQSLHGGSKKHKPLIAASITAGILILIFILIGSYLFLSKMIRKREDQETIEKILKKYKDMRPRRYSYANVKRMTNNFKEKISQGSYATLHKGMLIDETPVAVKMLNGSEQTVEDFIADVDKIGRMQHVNVLQLIGYCVEGDKRCLIYEFLPCGTLEKFVFSENERRALDWENLRQIAVGIGRGIEYVHQECRPNALILDINPQNILLDNNFGPKLLVLPVSASQGVTEYIAPEIFSSSSETVSPKADVYSFGMLLLDTVRRRRNFPGGEEEKGQVYFPEWIHNQMVNEEERTIQIEEEGGENERAKKLSVVGLWCIQWFPSDRPPMKGVIQMLQGDRMPSKPPNPFANFKNHKRNSTS